MADWTQVGILTAVKLMIVNRIIAGVIKNIEQPNVKIFHLYI